MNSVWAGAFGVVGAGDEVVTEGVTEGVLVTGTGTGVAGGGSTAPIHCLGSISPVPAPGLPLRSFTTVQWPTTQGFSGKSKPACFSALPSSKLASAGSDPRTP